MGDSSSNFSRAPAEDFTLLETKGKSYGSSLILWYNEQMQKRKRLLRLLVGYAMLALAVIIASAAFAMPRTFARVLEGNELLLTQIRADFDRDYDVDFGDFTVFSALYEEN